MTFPSHSFGSGIDRSEGSFADTRRIRLFRRTGSPFLGQDGQKKRVVSEFKGSGVQTSSVCVCDLKMANCQMRNLSSRFGLLSGGGGSLGIGFSSMSDGLVSLSENPGSLLSARRRRGNRHGETVSSKAMNSH